MSRFGGKKRLLGFRASLGPHVGSGLRSFNLIETNQILVGTGAQFDIGGIGVYNVDVYPGCFCVCD